MGRTFGYARVSTREQNLDRQMDALRRFGVRAGDVFSDKASGKDFERTEWVRLMEEVAEGDVIVVGSIDRLGRDYDEVLDVWRRITKEAGADIVVLDMPLLDTRQGVDGAMGRLITDIVLALLSYFAQDERERIRARQAEGIASAKARGVQFGRPRKKRPGCYRATKADYLGGEITRKEAARRLGVCPSTLDMWLREDAEGESQVG